jgi:hypothetical protein
MHVVEGNGSIDTQPSPKSDDSTNRNPALPGGALHSRPTWRETFGCSATSAFFAHVTGHGAEVVAHGNPAVDMHQRRLRYSKGTLPCP